MFGLIFFNLYLFESGVQMNCVWAGIIEMQCWDMRGLLPGKAQVLGGGRILLTLVPGPEVPASCRELETAAFASHRTPLESDSLGGTIPSMCDLADSLGDSDLFSIIVFRGAGQPCPGLNLFLIREVQISS